ncbi:Mu transposase C-terminal domain-containing protein [Paenibacillus antri]|nr:Mu transposase C-terminal domain-containing protein [Paenibacillus antri]
MRTIRLQIDDEFEWQGAKFHVHAIEPPNVLIYREEGERKLVKVNYLSVITDKTFKIDDKSYLHFKRKEAKEDVLTSALLDSLSDERRGQAFQKKAAILPILIYDEAKSGNMYSAQTFNEKFEYYFAPGEDLYSLKRKDLLERIAHKFGKSERQIQRYLADYKKAESERSNHGIEALVSKAHLKAHNRNDEYAIELTHPKKKDMVLDTIYIRLKQPEKYAPILKVALEKFIIKKRRKVNILHEDLEIACTQADLPPLSYDTVYKIVSRIDKYVMERVHKGDVVDPQLVQEKAASQFAKAPLHLIEIDHVKLPITLIDPETGAELGEPWLTVAFCVYTRMVWGLDLSFEDPSGHKVMRTLLHGLFFKKTKESYGTHNDWEMHGKPSVILMDNGPDFQSTYVKSMIEDVLEAEVRYRPIATPRYGGNIERYFGTINVAFLQKLLGYRDKSTSDKEIRQEAKLEAILTLDNLRELLIHYITDVYHHSEHSGLPLECNTPAARLYTALDVMGNLPAIPEEDEAYYRIQLLPSELKSYRSDGIRLENVKYASQETSGFISRKQKNNCKVKYNVDDISLIYLLDPRSKIYVEVPSISPPADEIRGMSRKEYQATRKILIEKGKLTKQQIPGSELIRQGKLLIKEKYNQMVSTNTKARRAALRQGFRLQVAGGTTTSETIQRQVSSIEQLVKRIDTKLNQVRE